MYNSLKTIKLLLITSSISSAFLSNTAFGMGKTTDNITKIHLSNSLEKINDNTIKRKLSDPTITDDKINKKTKLFINTTEKNSKIHDNIAEKINSKPISLKNENTGKQEKDTIENRKIKNIRLTLKSTRKITTEPVKSKDDNKKSPEKSFGNTKKNLNFESEAVVNNDELNQSYKTNNNHQERNILKDNANTAHIELDNIVNESAQENDRNKHDKISNLNIVDADDKKSLNINNISEISHRQDQLSSVNIDNLDIIADMMWNQYANDYKNENNSNVHEKDFDIEQPNYVQRERLAQHKKQEVIDKAVDYAIKKLEEVEQNLNQNNNNLEQQPVAQGEDNNIAGNEANNENNNNIDDDYFGLRNLFAENDNNQGNNNNLVQDQNQGDQNVAGNDVNNENNNNNNRELNNNENVENLQPVANRQDEAQQEQERPVQRQLVAPQAQPIARNDVNNGQIHQQEGLIQANRDASNDEAIRNYYSNNVLVELLSKAEGKRSLSNLVAQNPKHAYKTIREHYNNATDEDRSAIKKEIALALTDAAQNLPKDEQALGYHLHLATMPEAQAKAVVDKASNHAIDKASVKLNINDIVDKEVSNRIDNIGAYSISGIASGDEDKKWLHGVWISGLYGANKQKQDKNIAGYNARSSGATIGADFEISEGTIVGLAYSHILSNYKYKNDKIGDKLNARSHVISLYGQKELNDKFLLQAILSYSNSSIKETDRKTTDGIVANGKFKSNAISIDTMLGYKIPLDNNLLLIPNIGLKYGYYKDSAYTQKNASVHNLRISSHSDSSFTGTFGAKLALTKQVSEHTLMMPSIHASIENYFNNKTKKAKAQFTWSDSYLENELGTGKKPKMGYNVGASLLTKHKNIEVLATYNLHARKKYQGHQGSLKLKLLF